MPFVFTINCCFLCSYLESFKWELVLHLLYQVTKLQFLWIKKLDQIRIQKLWPFIISCTSLCSDIFKLHERCGCCLFFQVVFQPSRGWMCKWGFHHLETTNGTNQLLHYHWSKINIRFLFFFLLIIWMQHQSISGAEMCFLQLISVIWPSFWLYYLAFSCVKVSKFRTYYDINAAIRRDFAMRDGIDHPFWLVLAKLGTRVSTFKTTDRSVASTLLSDS